MTHTTLLRAASLTTLCLVGCTDQKHIDLGHNGAQTASFTPPTPARQLAVDATSLYWLSWNIPPPPGWQGPESSLVYVTKSAKDGSNATVLAQTGFSVGNLYSDFGLRVDASYAYFTDGMFLSKARVDGSGVTTLVPLSAQGTLGGLAIDDGMIYWSSQQTGITQLPKTGGMPTVLSSNVFLTGQVAVDTNSVYWVGSTTINFAPKVARIDKPAGMPSKLSPATFQTSLTADNSNLYFEADNVVRKIPGVGGPPIVMMSGAAITSDIASDVDFLYVVRDYTTIVKIAKAGYAQTTLLQGAPGDPHINTLAVDATDVYFSDENGDISHVAK